jgi:MoxR-like ATPase
VTFNNPLFAPASREQEDSAAKESEDHDAYVFHDSRITDAVNVAMAARRPLLVTGNPGSGKSSLARAVALEKKWAYVEHVVTSRTGLADLTADFDAVRRLADAQLHRLLPDWCYVEPGVLWWAFAPESAVNRGHDPAKLPEKQRAVLPSVRDPRQCREDSGARENSGSGEDSGSGVVVLLDEIDKAEPDLPNDLLGPLDKSGFEAPGVGWIGAKPSLDVFVVITSNRERRLPPAFLRRCAQLDLKPADDTFFIAVAKAHFGTRDDTMYENVAAEFIRYQEAASKRDRREPSTAEFLDTVRACRRFDESPGSPGWRAIVETALWKDPALPEEVVGATG